MEVVEKKTVREVKDKNSEYYKELIREQLKESPFVPYEDKKVKKERGDK